MPHPDAQRFPLKSQLYLALLWLAFFAQWMTVVPILAPDQVATILGPGSTTKEGISGTVTAAGALVSLLITPIAGSLSDRLRAKRGRRRPFLILGTLGSCVALALLMPFHQGSSIPLYVLAIMNLQFWWNLGAGPYAGLIADVVPKPDQGMASGWMNVMSIAGTVLGNILITVCYKTAEQSTGQSNGQSSDPRLFLALMIVLNLLCLAGTLIGVREPPAAGHTDKRDLRAYLRSFYIDPRRHANFYWVIVTRLFANMGVWSIFTFLLFYVGTVLGIARPLTVLPVLLGAGALVSVPASLIGVKLADRHGIVRIVGLTSWIMAGSALCYVLIAFHPSLVLVAPVVIVFSAGYGAYQSVDWALALAVLPSSDEAGKDMGIWHVSMILPQILGPGLTGWLISGLTLLISARFAYTVAFAIAALWFAAAAWFVTRIRLPHPVAALPAPEAA